MNLPNLLSNFHLEKVRLNLKMVQAEFSFRDADKEAAWDLYVELLTRTATQPLPQESGDEAAALESVYSIFQATRTILREHGRGSIQFSKVAVPVLNQVIRPFTTKWHRESQAGAFGDYAKRQDFRRELAILQEDLRNYNSLLAHIADVEDLTTLEQKDGDRG